MAPQGRARPGCARSRQGTEFAGSRFRSSTVKFVPRHGRPNARRDLDHAAAARPRRSGHLIAAAIKRYSVSSIPGARPRRGRACATPWPSGGRALRLGGPPGCDELTYPRRCDRQPARSRRPAQPSLRVRADLRARAPASLLVANRRCLASPPGETRIRARGGFGLRRATVAGGREVGWGPRGRVPSLACSSR